MTTRNVPDLKELFKQASEIAQQVPPSMQEAAFHRALDLLTGAAEKIATPVSTSQKARTPPASSKRVPAAENGVDPTETLLTQIDSTQHPAVISATKILDRALMVLKIALDEHETDGLSPSAIATVLTDKFRVSATSATVSTALGRATSLVNRVPNGGGFIYRIMAPGQEYLNTLGSSDSSESRKASSPRVVKRGKPKATAAGKKADSAIPSPATPTKSTRTARRGSSGGLAPKAAVLALIAEGFFNTGKTGQAVHSHLKAKRGFHIQPDQLRLALLRLVRDQALGRESNADGDYEYKRGK